MLSLLVSAGAYPGAITEGHAWSRAMCTGSIDVAYQMEGSPVITGAQEGGFTGVISRVHVGYR